jgi:hypothetical protein
MVQITVLTNVYNEEYLMPFWLEHHRTIFDHGIVFDWGCTDRSMDIVREMCPTWEIRKAIDSHPSKRLEKFDAYENDVLFMYAEMKLSGYKIVLNTTEFLVSSKPIREYLADETNKSYPLQSLTVFSRKDVQEPTTLRELFDGIECVEPKIRKWRTLHSRYHGRYSLGRHEITLEPFEIPPVYILWLGVYPWNASLLARGLQIAEKIPDSDYENNISYHHRFTAEQRTKNRLFMLDLSVPLTEVPLLSEALL